MDNNITADVFGMMQSGEPLKVYKKTIIGKVNVKIMDPFQNRPSDIILEGLPQNEDDKCFVELWSQKEVVYFLRANKRHLDDGVLIEYAKPRVTEIKQTVNNMTEDDVNELVVAPFKKMESVVKKITSETALQRILVAAEFADRPIKTMEFLREKLALLQSGEIDADRDSD